LKRLVAVAVLSMSTVLAGVGASYGQDKVVRIGFQKYGKLVLLKSKGTLEDKLTAAGYRVVWTEFPSGPPLLEALNVGAIDFGNAGEAPPIFAQAAGAPLQYVAYEPPAPRGEAILVPKDSKLNSVADLRGKKVALKRPPAREPCPTAPASYRTTSSICRRRSFWRAIPGLSIWCWPNSARSMTGPKAIFTA
jgi:sulfonate transport system substrate-binding protein